MTNLLNALNIDETQAKDIIEYGIENVAPNGIIYNVDILNIFRNYEDDIKEIIEDITNVDIYNMGVEEFDNLMVFLNLDTFEDRINYKEIQEKALEIVAEDNNITVDDANSEDYEEHVFDERYYLATELNKNDKINLVWRAIEVECLNIYED